MVSLYRLKQWNEAYRLGNPVVSDEKYDAEKQKYESAYGKIDLLDISASQEVKLETVAGSLDKIDNFDALINFIEGNEVVYVSPKLDGISITKQNGISLTRGSDGILGNDVSHHFSHINGPDDSDDCRGEVVIKWIDFIKYFEPLGYSHPRNAVAGLFNPNTENSNVGLLSHVVFMPFQKNGVIQSNVAGINHILPVQDIVSDQNVLDVIFESWSKTYPCDGLVISLSNQIEYGDGINPKNKIAYKPKKYCKVGESEVIGVSRQPSAVGRLSPVLQIKPIHLDGATISNVFVDNEAFCKSLGIGVGTKIELIRSGGIIPRLSKVNGIQLTFEKGYVSDLFKRGAKVYDIITDAFGDGTSVNLYEPYIEPHIWKGLDIYLVDLENPQILCRRIDFFLKTFKCKNIGEKTILSIIENFGVKTLEDFLLFNFDSLLDFDGFGSKAVQKIKDSMKRLDSVGESRLMSSVRIFDKLGEEKLKIFLSEGINAKGLGEHAESEIREGMESWNKFKSFFVSTGRKIFNDYDKREISGNVYCHTKCRIPKNIISLLESQGHEVVDSYNKRVTHIVVPSLSETSTKIRKGLTDGASLVLLSSLLPAENNEEQSLF
jgi:DNA ligase (NAD+)